MPSDTPDSDRYGRAFSRTLALRWFADFPGPTQSQQHIKPLHEYVATRLVFEGGFAPDELRPHPPLRTVGATNRTRRTAWAVDSPALSHPAAVDVDYRIRAAS